MQTAYPFGCIGADGQQPKNSVGINLSQAVSYRMWYPGTNLADIHEKTVWEQYVMFPTAQAAAAEQQRLEATVTPACLDSHRFPAANDSAAFTVAGTQSPYSQGGFAGTTVHETTTTEDASPIHAVDQMTEARDVSVLAIVWVDETNIQPIGAGFQADATATTGKALDKLAATGH